MLPTWTSELDGNLMQTADTSCIWQTPRVISIFATNNHPAPSWTRFSPHNIPHFLYIQFNIILLSTSRCSMQSLPHAFPSQCVLHAPAIYPVGRDWSSNIRQKKTKKMIIQFSRTKPSLGPIRRRTQRKITHYAPGTASWRICRAIRLFPLRLYRLDNWHNDNHSFQ